MKRNFTILLSSLLLLSVITVQSQAVRKVLVEEFTNASCGPCAVYGPAFTEKLRNQAEHVVVLKYQCEFPGVDPMNAQNKSEVSTRYNSTYPAVPSQGIPYCAMDGNKYNGHIANLTEQLLINRAAVTSPLEMTLDHNLTVKNDSVAISVTIKNVSSNPIAANAAILHIALIEKVIKFASPPGTNGDKTFPSVMRKMVPNANGTTLTTELPAGESKTFNFTIPVPSYIYDYTQLGVVSFVQMKTSKEILQARESLPKPLLGNFYDVSANYTPETRTSYCDNIYSVSIELTNKSTGTDTIKSIGILPYQNGAKRPRSVWKGTLLPGEKTTYKISNISLPNGIVRYSWTIDTIITNNGVVKDVGSVNNLSDEYRLIVVPNAAASAPLNFDFENVSVGSIPTNLYTELGTGFRTFVADKSAGGVTWEMGGFGQSAKSLFIDLNSPAPGITSNFIFSKLNFSAVNNAKFFYSIAHAQAYDFSDNSIDLQYSTDCGATWKSAGIKSGKELASVADPVDPLVTFFVPQVDQWKTDSFDLKELDGLADVLIKLAITSGGGQSLFLDDFSFREGAAPVGFPEIENLRSITVYPNPVSKDLGIELISDAVQVLRFEVLDLNGRVVSQFGQKNISAGKNILQFPIDLTSGMYQLKISSPNGVSTRKINVQ